MNELRWILLIAGALLIAGIYVWGLRSRSRRLGPEDAARRPAVFSGGATGFEQATTAPDDQDAPEPGIGLESRRIEPSVSIDEDALDTQRPAIERRGDFEPDIVEPELPVVRREPTLARRVEPAGASRGDLAAGGRMEPTLGARAEPGPAASAPPWDEADLRDDGPAREPAAVRAEPRPAPTPAAAATGGVAAAAEASAKAKRPPQKIFAVRVSAAGASRFTGQRVLEALKAEGLEFGRYDIFHCLHGDGRPVFSVASLRDPGTFDLRTMAETQYPGILVFTVLPGPVGASEAFDDMLFTARALATHLEGALADEKGVPLTAHRAGRMREEALEFERSLHAA